MAGDPSQVVDVAHRGGRKTAFIPPLTGPRTDWETVIRAAADPVQRGEIAAQARATIRWVDDDDRPVVRGLSLSELRELAPDEMLAVRRPSSYVGQRNYISAIPGPTRAGRPRTVWCESFGELAHFRDLLIGYDVEQLASQPCRLEWLFPTGGLRVHIPDLILRTREGATLVVDVSVDQRVADPKTWATFLLTRATCELLGWRYEVRTQMPAQRVRNVQFVNGFRYLQPAQADQWLRRLRGLRGKTRTVQSLAAALGDGDSDLGLPGVWWLVGTGLLHANLSDPLRPDTVLLPGRMGTASADWLVLS